MQRETIEYFERKLESKKKEFEDALAAERENCRKDMEELYAVCENIVISEIYDIYYVDFILCSYYIMMQKISGTVPQCTHEDDDDDDDQFP